MHILSFKYIQIAPEHRVSICVAAQLVNFTLRKCFELDSLFLSYLHGFIVCKSHPILLFRPAVSLIIHFDMYLLHVTQKPAFQARFCLKTSYNYVSWEC